MRTNKLAWYVIPLGIVMLIVGVVIGRLSASGADKANENQAINNATTTKSDNVVMAVEALSPTEGMISQGVHASGVIAGKDESAVGTRISGVAVTQVLVEEGDWVKAGQVLAVLDDQAIKQDVTAAQAKLRTAQAALAKATADLQRVEPLIKIDAISREQYDGYRTAKVQAENDVIAAQSALNNSSINRGNSQVVAPVSGIISKKNAEVGMMATGSALFTIIKGGVLEWQASVPADKAMQLQLGQAVTLKLNNTNQADNANPQIMGNISRISPIANTSRELTVHATLDSHAPVVAGMFVSGEFLVGADKAWLIPARVVSSNDGYDYVWTLKATTSTGIYEAVLVQINVLKRMGDMVATDLPNDTLVVKQGGNFLSNGDKVRLVDNSNANAKTAP